MNRLASCASIAVAVALLVPASSSAAHDDDRPGFLTFSASRTQLRNSQSVIVDVGLRSLRDEEGRWRPARREELWFQITINDSSLGQPGRRRWTDGRSCPDAVAELDRVRDLTMPRPMLPVPGPNGEAVEEGDIYVDGRGYTLSMRSASLQGQAVGRVEMSSNVETDLARWVERMLAVLEPCWSRTMPDDMDSLRGTDTDARINGPLRPRER